MKIKYLIHVHVHKEIDDSLYHSAKFNADINLLWKYMFVLYYN